MRPEAPEPNRGGTATSTGKGDGGASGSPYRRSGLRSLAMAAFALLSAPPIGATVPADLLYFALRNSIVVMDPNDGSVTGLEPQVADFRGLPFDSTGGLLATADVCIDELCFLTHHVLVEVDPLTGEIREEIGEVRDAAGSPIIVVALATEPDTDLLFGLGGAVTGFPQPEFPDLLKLWHIEAATGVASLIGSPAGCPEIGCPFAVSPFVGSFGLDFGPDGTLHATLAASQGNLLTLDADTGALISSQSIDRTIHGNAPLAVRSDGTLFSHSAAVTIRPPRPCRTCPPPPPETFPSYVATIDESTGAVTEIAPGVSTPFGHFPTDLTFSPVVVLSIDIDIRPGSKKNPLNPKGRGVVPVAILGSDGFDVTELDRTTLAFGPAGAPAVRRAHIADVNRDDRDDLLAFFKMDASGIALGDTEACVTGELQDGTPIEGCDAIVTLPTRCGAGFELALLLPAAIWVRRRR